MITDLLTYLPSPPRGVWYFGPIPLRAYALCIVAGILVALWLGDRRWVARGGERGVVYDVALWAVPFGLVGGRVYHLMTDWPEYVKPGGPGWAGMWRIWDGGLGIWGAVALGGVGAWIACRRRGIPLPAFGDAVAPGILLAQAIGRLGNYFNQELYGRETDVPWGLEIFNRGPNGCWGAQPFDGVSTGDVCAVVHPTFLYELLWNLVVVAVLLVVDRRFRIGHGRLFALYVAGYCVGRFGVELLRADHASMPIADIRVNSFTSAFVFIGAVVYMVLAPKGREDPATLGGPEAEQADEEHAGELVAVGAAAGAASPKPAVDLETRKAEPPEPEMTPEPEVEAEQPETTEPPTQDAETEATGTTADDDATADNDATADDGATDESEPAEPEPEPEPDDTPADETAEQATEDSDGADDADRDTEVDADGDAEVEAEQPDEVETQPEPEPVAADSGAAEQPDTPEPSTQDAETEATGTTADERAPADDTPADETAEPATEPEADTGEAEPAEPVAEDSDDAQEVESAEAESESDSKPEDADKTPEPEPKSEDADDTDGADGADETQRRRWWRRRRNQQ